MKQDRVSGMVFRGKNEVNSEKRRIHKRKSMPNHVFEHTLYKWFTLCVLGPVNEYLDRYNLMEDQQQGAKAGRSGTTDNLLIDRMVTLDCHRRKRNMSVACIDVREAYDSIDHGWMKEIMQVHKFPIWICEVVSKLCASWKH